MVQYSTYQLSIKRLLCYYTADCNGTSGEVADEVTVEQAREGEW